MRLESVLAVSKKHQRVHLLVRAPSTSCTDGRSTSADSLGWRDGTQLWRECCGPSTLPDGFWKRLPGTSSRPSPLVAQ